MSGDTAHDQLRLGLVQMAPVLLDRAATLEKMVVYAADAGQQQCDLLVFGEAMLPGYPFWVAHTDGARFNDALQKEWYSRYYQEAVQLKAGHLDALCRAAAQWNMAVVTGIIERAEDRGGHSLYCSLIYITASGKIANVHRKLMPTYEERLVWAAGDGHGLRTFPLGAFTMGALNCWENWMPLARTALYGQGEDLHLALWPGCVRNTDDLTRFLAKEGRSYVVSVSGLMRREDFADNLPQIGEFRARIPAVMADGGTCVAAPDGSWVIAPVTGVEQLLVTTIDHARVREERQNFDPAGHYARPDVLELIVKRERQRSVRFQ